jgi:hypothetical protein
MIRIINLKIFSVIQNIEINESRGIICHVSKIVQINQGIVLKSCTLLLKE